MPQPNAPRSTASPRARSAHARSARPGPARRAFTIIEAIVIIVILGILATLVAPRVFQWVGRGKTAAAESKAAALVLAVQQYQADVGTPPSGASLVALLWDRSQSDANWKGPYVENAEALKDPWGNDFLLVIPPTKNATFDIVSYGADAQPGGEGEDKDIVKP
ncbi:MAG: type II secretion system protein GspG [Planctomyces sp.]|nr:type II secretion system protein GspG [Planctomyces sp.]MBA4119977.1 type II secretion system protein GspG [Isosphaera sp.]